MRNLVLIACAAGALVAAQASEAAIVTRHDQAGRAVTFDVRVPGVKVGWYAATLENAVHGDEIQTARIRIVSRARVSNLCAGGRCAELLPGQRKGGHRDDPRRAFGRSRTQAPARVRPPHRHGAFELLRTSHPWASSWWAARGMKTLLANGRVSPTYSLGWGRAVGEIFAEDYVQLNLRTNYFITALARPGSAVKAALRRDLRSTGLR